MFRSEINKKDGRCNFSLPRVWNLGILPWEVIRHLARSIFRMNIFWTVRYSIILAVARGKWYHTTDNTLFESLFCINFIYRNLTGTIMLRDTDTHRASRIITFGLYLWFCFKVSFCVVHAQFETSHRIWKNLRNRGKKLLHQTFHRSWRHFTGRLFTRFTWNVVTWEIRGGYPTASDTSDTLEGF